LQFFFANAGVAALKPVVAAIAIIAAVVITITKSLVLAFLITPRIMVRIIYSYLLTLKNLSSFVELLIFLPFPSSEPEVATQRDFQSLKSLFLHPHFRCLMTASLS
jgi:hypothetical protein